MNALASLSRRRPCRRVVRPLTREEIIHYRTPPAVVDDAPGRVARVWILLLIVAVWWPILATAQPATRVPSRAIAVLDLDLLIDSAPGRPAAAQRFSQQVRDAERLVQVVGDSLRMALDVLSREEARLTRAEREVALHLLRAREIRLEDMVQQLALVMENERLALREPIVGTVREAVREVQAREGWVLVLDRRALGELVEADDAIDITRRVLAVMRSRAAAQ